MLENSSGAAPPADDQPRRKSIHLAKGAPDGCVQMALCEWLFVNGLLSLGMLVVSTCDCKCVQKNLGIVQEGQDGSGSAGSCHTF